MRIQAFWHAAAIATGIGLPLLFSLPAPAAENYVGINPSACRKVTVGSTSADVEYKPGVDVNGRAVVPADGPGGSLDPAAGRKMLEVIRIPITVDLAKRMGLGAGGTKFGSEVPLGEVTLRNGQVYLDGAPLTNSEQQQINDACRRAGFR
ncbi:hypothetical protein [Novispirillum itersonii]|uniref:hypothetical protein n=1 Tax=Novispirillum itersonii TaxID=189 RepID=UPI00035C2215|nr:hypothetical protein [Novispirillum itersonii]